jgi:hypothetical protein
MPFPTAECGDAVVFYDGTTAHPATATIADPGSGIISLTVANSAMNPPNPSNAYFLKTVPYDATRATTDSWSWPSNTGSNVGNWRVVAGTTATVAATDRFLSFTDDHTRVVTLVVLPAGTQLTFVDTSGSSTAGNTITFTGTPTISATATIVPGTTTTCTLVSDGTNYWLLNKR